MGVSKTTGYDTCSPKFQADRFQINPYEFGNHIAAAA